MKPKEPWLVFAYNGKRLCSYTLQGTFTGEAEATKEMLASEHGIPVSQIEVTLEWKQAEYNDITQKIIDKWNSKAYNKVIR